VIENTYAVNGNRKVVVFTISMGAPYLNSFFQNHVTQEWKDQYILELVSTSGVFGGASETIQQIFGGYNWGISWISNADFQLLVSGIVSAYYMLPQVPIWGDYPFIQAADGNFTSSEFPTLLEALGIDVVPKEYVTELVNDVTPVNGPGVQVQCLYGTDVPTVLALKYNVPVAKILTTPAETIMTGGDGTVVYDSLSLCKNWKSNANKTVVPYEFPGALHVDFITDPKLMEFVVQLILNTAQ